MAFRHHKSYFQIFALSLLLFTIHFSPFTLFVAYSHEFQLRYGGSLRDAPDTTQLAELTLTSESSYDFDSDWRLNTIFRLRHESAKHLKPTDLQQANYNTASKPWILSENSELELREFYLEGSFSNHYLSIGKQQIIWGRSDGLKVLDVVNPQSFREFVLEDFDDSRIPLWSANLEISLPDSSTLQTLWIPDTTTHALPNRDGRFAFTTPRIVPQAPAGIPIQLKEDERPNESFSDSDFGLRWTAFKGGWDLTLNYLYHYEDLPVFSRQVDDTLNAPQITVTPRYQRSHLLGTSFTNSFGDLTLRGEIAYETDKAHISKTSYQNDGYTTHDTFSYVLGFDWFGFSDTIVSLQVFQSHLIDSTESLSRPATDTTLTLNIQRDFLNETLRAEILLIQNLHDHDGMIRPKLAYDLNDSLTITLGGDILYGSRQGLYGQFKDNTRAHTTLTYSF